VPSDQSDEATRSHVWGMVPGGAARVLVFWEGGAVVRDLADGATLVIGRSQDCDVHVIHPSVSRRHVAIHGGPPVTVEDLGSQNGTRISGEVLAPGKPMILAAGAVVEAGSAMVVLQTPAQSADGPGPSRASTALPAESGMQRLERLLRLVAGSGLSVILLGETGVGKEVLAERIHRTSPRAPGPFVRLNCAALPEALLESELFGHERGAFTGAVKSKQGLLEVAAGGTVFLDEVAELSPATQAKLLRVLESREVLPLGALQPRSIDVRFIAATNRDLRALVERETFRRDLYFRLNGITLPIPPLRERKGEIEGLAREFMALASARAGRGVPSLSRSALDALMGHEWTGNVRELRNTVERAVVLCQGDAILPDHLVLEAPPPTRAGTPASEAAPSDGQPALRSQVETFERARIMEALEQAGGNQSRAAELLGVSRRTLVARLSAYGLTKVYAPRTPNKG
jgi:two-component system response regulator AtoC